MLMFWKIGCKSFSEFFERFAEVNSKSLNMTHKVLDEREQLEKFIPMLQQEICTSLAILDQLQQEEQVIKKYIDQIDATKDFEYEITRTSRDLSTTSPPPRKACHNMSDLQQDMP